MARPERFELPTYRTAICCSIQLSYGRKFGCNYSINFLKRAKMYNTYTLLFLHSQYLAIIAIKKEERG